MLDSKKFTLVLAHFFDFFVFFFFWCRFCYSFSWLLIAFLGFCYLPFLVLLLQLFPSLQVPQPSYHLGAQESTCTVPRARPVVSHFTGVVQLFWLQSLFGDLSCQMPHNTACVSSSKIATAWRLWEFYPFCTAIATLPSSGFQIHWYTWYLRM